MRLLQGYTPTNQHMANIMDHKDQEYWQYFREEEDDPDQHRNLKVGCKEQLERVKKRLKTSRANLKTCRAKRNELALSSGAPNASDETPSFLYVQMGTQCMVSRNQDVFTISSSHLSPETWAFSDRPFKVQETILSTDFIDDFDTNFSEETGGKPNAAFTFHHEEDDRFEGPVVAIMTEATYTDGPEGRTYTYTLDQSEDQAKEMSLNDIFEGHKHDEEYFTDCSFFIDSVLNGVKYEVKKDDVYNEPQVFVSGTALKCPESMGYHDRKIFKMIVRMKGTNKSGTSETIRFYTKHTNGDINEECVFEDGIEKGKTKSCNFDPGVDYKNDAIYIKGGFDRNFVRIDFIKQWFCLGGYVYENEFQHFERPVDLTVPDTQIEFFKNWRDCGSWTTGGKVSRTCMRLDTKSDAELHVSFNKSHSKITFCKAARGSPCG